MNEMRINRKIIKDVIHLLFYIIGIIVVAWNPLTIPVVNLVMWCYWYLTRKKGDTFYAFWSRHMLYFFLFTVIAGIRAGGIAFLEAEILYVAVLFIAGL